MELNTCTTSKRLRYWYYRLGCNGIRCPIISIIRVVVAANRPRVAIVIALFLCSAIGSYSRYHFCIIQIRSSMVWSILSPFKEAFGFVLLCVQQYDIIIHCNLETFWKYRSFIPIYVHYSLFGELLVWETNIWPQHVVIPVELCADLWDASSLGNEYICMCLSLGPVHCMLTHMKEILKIGKIFDKAIMNIIMNRIYPCAWQLLAELNETNSP